MQKPKVTLATSRAMPDLYPGEMGLLSALANRGIDPQIAVWNDPNFDWNDAGMVVVRSVVDYADDRHEFLAWARRIPRIVNHVDVLEWNSDKHYLDELAQRGLPTIPTTWLSAARGYTKHQVHSRFPVFGDFVVKPAVSSDSGEVGRYSSTDILQRQAAMSHVMELLSEGRDVMIQRYQKAIETEGERSLIFFNGLLSHSASKKALFEPYSVTEGQLIQTKARLHQASDQELVWAEQIRRVLHEYQRDRIGRDEQFLFNRVDLVPDGKGSFMVMELALVDADLFLNSAPDALENFADAIAMRAHW